MQGIVAESYNFWGKRELAVLFLFNLRMIGQNENHKCFRVRFYLKLQELAKLQLFS